MIGESGLRLEERDGAWSLTGPAASRFGLVDEFLAYLTDRFCRWLIVEEQSLTAMTTQVLLRFLRACREATVPGRPGRT